GITAQAVWLGPSGDSGVDVVSSMVSLQFSRRTCEYKRTLGSRPTALISPLRTFRNCGLKCSIRIPQREKLLADLDFFNVSAGSGSVDEADAHGESLKRNVVSFR